MENCGVASQEQREPPGLNSGAIFPIYPNTPTLRYSNSPFLRPLSSKEIVDRLKKLLGRFQVRDMPHVGDLHQPCARDLGGSLFC